MNSVKKSERKRVRVTVKGKKQHHNNVVLVLLADGEIREDFTSSKAVFHECDITLK